MHNLHHTIIYNNIPDAQTCPRRLCIQHALTRGGLVTMIHKRMACYENITKIVAPLELTPYVKNIIIINKPLNPILLIHVYMPSHEEDTPSVLIIQTTIKQTPHSYLSSCRRFQLRQLPLDDKSNTPPTTQDDKEYTHP